MVLKLVDGPLLLVSQNGITVLTSANTPCVDHVTHEDTAITYFACVCHLEDHLHRGFHQWITADDGQCHSLNDVSRVLHAAVYPFLSALSDAVYVMVLKPVDVRTEQGLLDLLKLRFPEIGRAHV